ncbi:MAG TPA: UDP-N-acetylmuramoyl-L-alanyl-D-glutamate--2,6-diaminopimelate ligase [Candidatus Paceibacterota bacterium]|nr:UDP-N-acetylmuramoyl-L-alanyl-D-glutamate--2,6-diaminopimelate ligase [Candidatus Paceibacterota bacterium]
MEDLLRTIEKKIPRWLYRLSQPFYHYLLAWAGAVRYGFPSRQLTIIAVTGTKGKSSTTELIAELLRAGGHKTASVSTVQIQVGDDRKPNTMKMTTPGRFFLQRLLRQAVDAGCTHAVLEMSSEGARFYRHKHIDFDALVFTNLAPEHIESHGSFAKYKKAKLRLAEAVAQSPKPKRALIVNADDEAAEDFLDFSVPHKYTYSLKQAEPYKADGSGSVFSFEGTSIRSPLPGTFSIYNMLAAATTARHFGVSLETVQSSLERFAGVAGRAENVTVPNPKKQDRQKFQVVVDYAHTADSLKGIYEAFPNQRKICVLGSCGGGRDKWKRPLMGEMAGTYCNAIFLTNEDPYDEDPEAIIKDVAAGIPSGGYSVILDRREAIREALKAARPGDVVLITGKGTDPFIMGPNGTKEPWSDKRVAEEELEKIL